MQKISLKNKYSGTLKICKQAWNDEDPLNLYNIYDEYILAEAWPRDEYDRYAAMTARLIMNNADENEFFYFVRETFCVTMGMEAAPEHEIRKFSHRLISISEKVNSPFRK